MQDFVPSADIAILKVDFGDFQFLRIEPKVVRYVSGVATASLASAGLYALWFLYFQCLSSFQDVCSMNILVYLLLLFIFSEFSSEEFRTAKVDPIYQFSKPITVCPSESIICSWSISFLLAISLNYVGLGFFFQSHMNKDHADDTKLIVQHSTSIPVLVEYT